MDRIIKLECNCLFHQIVIEDFNVHGEDMLSICVYEHKSGNTGKLLKKPKLLGDVVLNKEQVEQLKDFLKNE